MSEIILNEDQSTLMGKLEDWYNHFDPFVKPYFSYSGRAGTGKTTVITEFVSRLGLNRNEYVCCALIGKAVLVMQKKGLPAQTIHSLIFEVIFSGSGDDEPSRFEFKLKESLPKALKLIIVDEATMVPDDMVELILSFGIPVIFTGDMHQLPPVFGNSTVMMKPDHMLRQLMRQSENDPIVWIADKFYNGFRVPYGEYGQCHVMDNLFMGENLLNDYDVILCASNKTRDVLNNYIRNEILGIHKDKYPYIGDKMICRQNEWSIMLDGYSLTNGTVGYIRDLVLPRRRDANMKRPRMKISFQPDYMPKSKQFKHLSLDLNYLWATPQERKFIGLTQNIKFEYGYALTTHLSQGSEYPRVLFIDEPAFDSETRCRLKYTAATRASLYLDVLDYDSGFKYNRHIQKFISQYYKD